MSHLPILTFRRLKKIVEVIDISYLYLGANLSVNILLIIIIEPAHRDKSVHVAHICQGAGGVGTMQPVMTMP